MVTHNMQQAARISDKTAFFLLGEVIEFQRYRATVFSSVRQENAGLYYREVWLMRIRLEEQLQQLNLELIKMGRAVRGCDQRFDRSSF